MVWGVAVFVNHSIYRHKPHQTVLRIYHVCETAPSLQRCCVLQAVLLYSAESIEEYAVQLWHTAAAVVMH